MAKKTLLRKHTDWGMTGQSWEGIIECEHCAPRYSFKLEMLSIDRQR